MLQLVNYRGEGRALACKYENKEYQKNKVRMCAKRAGENRAYMRTSQMPATNVDPRETDRTVDRVLVSSPNRGTKSQNSMQGRRKHASPRLESYCFSCPSADCPCSSFSVFPAGGCWCCCCSPGGPCGGPGGTPLAPFTEPAALGSGMGTFAFGLRAISWACVAWSAARRVAFSIRSWSTIVRHSSHRRFASSAEASAASSNCERDSSVLTCLKEEDCGQRVWSPGQNNDADRWNKVLDAKPQANTQESALVGGANSHQAFDGAYMRAISYGSIKSGSTMREVGYMREYERSRAQNSLKSRSCPSQAQIPSLGRLLAICERDQPSVTACPDPPRRQLPRARRGQGESDEKHVLVSSFSECPLRLPVLLGSLALAQGPP